MIRLDDVINSMDVSLSKLREIVKDREVGHAVHEVAKSQTRLSNSTTTNNWLHNTIHFTYFGSSNFLKPNYFHKLEFINNP